VLALAAELVEAWAQSQPDAVVILESTPGPIRRRR
jgi:hypothetical protein